MFQVSTINIQMKITKNDQKNIFINYCSLNNVQVSLIINCQNLNFNRSSKIDYFYENLFIFFLSQNLRRIFY